MPFPASAAAVLVLVSVGWCGFVFESIVAVTAVGVEVVATAAVAGVVLDAVAFPRRG